jgi:hypothetical protein
MPSKSQTAWKGRPTLAPQSGGSCVPTRSVGTRAKQRFHDDFSCRFPGDLQMPFPREYHNGDLPAGPEGMLFPSFADVVSKIGGSDV